MLSGGFRVVCTAYTIESEMEDRLGAVYRRIPEFLVLDSIMRRVQSQERLHLRPTDGRTAVHIQ